MSSEAGGGRYFRVELISLNGIRGISRAALAVYWVLACYMNTEGWCWPSQKAISEKTGLCRSHLQRALKELEAKGWLYVQHSFGPPKWKHANRYRLLKYVSCGVQEVKDALPVGPGSPPYRASMAHPGEHSRAHPVGHGTITNGNNNQGTITSEQEWGRGKGIQKLPTGDELAKAWKGGRK